jgi:hypothetical protein
MNYYVGTVAAPLERLLGIGTLGVTTVRSSQVLGRQYNKTRSL